MSTTPDSAASAPLSWRALTPSARASTTPLALGIELRRRDASRHHWSAPRATSATVRDLARDPGELLLAVRPLRQSQSTGAWVQADASWDAVRRPNTQFDPAQSRWFGDLLSLARDSLLSGLSGDWLALDPVESRLLWPHLRDAASHGVPFVSTQRDVALVFAGHVEVTAVADRDPRNLLSLRAEAAFDGERAGGRFLRTVGHTGVYAYDVQGATATLYLGESMLPEALHRLIGAVAVHVPEAEEADFVRELSPGLRRAGVLRAGLGVTFPDLPVPTAALAVRFLPGDRVTYAWQWRYEGYGRFPFAASDDPVRDGAAETAARPEIESAWADVAGTAFIETDSLHDVDAAEFVAHIAPALEERGVDVSYHGERRSYHELAGDPEIRITTVESTDPDWFDLGVIVTIEGRTIPFRPLFTALSKGQKKMKLSDGGYFSLAHPALQRLKDLIDECTELAEWETGPRISRYQVALWDDFEDLADEAEPAITWRATAEGLRDAQAVPAVAVPQGLRATLRPYQQHGLDWLAFLWAHRLGGILADDMGLGKTVQILALLQHARESGERRPFLIVAPTSVTDTWVREARRFVPDLRLGVVARRPRSAATIARLAAQHDVLVTSYTVLRLGEDAFAEGEWAGLILDEAHAVKNAATLQHLAAARIRADVTFAVTGTPMENSLTDLWALLSLVAPGLFASAQRFRRDYVQPIERGKVAENAENGAHRAHQLERLRRRIRPLVLRRTKDEVAPDLPPKQEQVLRVDLSPAHRALYDVVLQRERQKILGLLRDLDRNRFIVFRSLTLLRMLSLSPGLIDETDARIGSRKIDVLLERIAEMQAEGHRALVFSQFTSYLALVARRLEKEGIPYAYLDGATRQRPAVIEGFRAGEQPVFLISLKAGGVGLTLTEADYVFLLDPWWNPAAEAQAIDRTHRIGQDNTVLVYRLIATDTIEEKVLALQQRKARLITAVMDDENLFAQTLTADDIRGLLD